MSKVSHTIMVVEDEQALLQAIKDKLELNGFSLVTARSVKQAKDYLEELNGVDAIWLDHYLLGSESGLDLVTFTKASDRWRHIPIFVVTNTAGKEEKASYIHLGVEKYYVKADQKIETIVGDLKDYLEAHEKE